MGDVERAETLSRDLLDTAGDDPRIEHFAYHFLADCALIRGDAETAEERYRESLRAALPLGDVIETSFEVQGVAMAAAGRGDLERALRLAASVEALWESLGTSFPISFWNALLERYIGAARERLGADADAIWSEGRELAFDDAVELALEPVLVPGRGPAGSRDPAGLPPPTSRTPAARPPGRCRPGRFPPSSRRARGGRCPARPGSRGLPCTGS